MFLGAASGTTPHPKTQSCKAKPNTYPAELTEWLNASTLCVRTILRLSTDLPVQKERLCDDHEHLPVLRY